MMHESEGKAMKVMHKIKQLEISASFTGYTLLIYSKKQYMLP